MLTLVMLACVDPPDRDGIAIGNPPNLAARLAPVSEAEVSTARLHVGEISSGCGTAVDSAVDLGEVDLIGVNQLPLPNPTLCVLSIGSSSPMELSLRLQDGRVLNGHLDLGTISLMTTASITAEGGLVLELGAPGWLDGAAIPGDVTTLEPGSAVHAQLVAALRSGSGIFVDTDEDGLLSTTERGAGSLLASSEAETAANIDPSGNADTASSDTASSDTASSDTASSDTAAADSGEECASGGHGCDDDEDDDAQ